MDVSIAADDTAALIDHIVARYHTVHRAELRELILLARQTERSHDLPVKTKGLADLLEDTLVELDAHMEKEERALFPMMKTNGCPLLAPPIARMRLEHADHEGRKRQLLAMIDDGEAPTEACAAWSALRAGIKKFAVDLTDHVHLENSLLFPRFEKR